MKKNLRLYLKLFSTSFSLSAFTLGGGYVIVPLMKKKFVDKLNWINEKEMLDLVAISQSSPGPIAVNASILIGYRIAGVFGALFTILGTVLPPLIVITIISFFYGAFKSNYYVNVALKGMQAGVAAIIVDVVANMFIDIKNEKKAVSIFIMAAAFISNYFLNINVIYIILSSGIIGFICYMLDKKAERIKK